MRIVFMGSAEVSCVMLDALTGAAGAQVVGAVTQPDRPAGRTRRLTPCPCRRRAADHGIEVLAPEQVNREEVFAAIAAWQPDAIVVVAYGQLLGRRLLALPRLGCINIHLSLLPRHRGAAPVQWAIAAGDAVTGVTAMRMDAGMDSGDTLGQVEEAIRPEDTAGSLYERLAPLGAGLLVRTLQELATGCARPTPQDASRVTLAPKIRKEDGWIDWSRPATQLALRVRAFNPWPSCHTTLPKRLQSKAMTRIKVHAAAVRPPLTGALQPGAFLGCDNEGPLIQTGEGTLCLRTVQGEGGKPMSGVEFLRGHAMWPGDMLGGKAPAGC
jgi:methionyl-tRNA formyltransferase